MKLKTIAHEQVYPYCGDKEIKNIIPYDGTVTGTKTTYANCDRTYELSKTYDGESDYDLFLESINNWGQGKNHKEDLKKFLEENN